MRYPKSSYCDDLSVRYFEEKDQTRLHRRITSLGVMMLRKVNGPIPLGRFAERIAYFVGVRLPADIDRLSDAVRVIFGARKSSTIAVLRIAERACRLRLRP